jgi:hypothetical protein
VFEGKEKEMNPIHVVQLWKGREVCFMSKQIEEGGKG